MSAPASIGIRWTLGDVGPRGFEALRLSIHGAWRVFGPRAAYAVCVNTISIESARQRTGPLPQAVAWHDVSTDLPAFLKSRLGPDMAEGVGWKLAPLRIFPDRHELSLDNDCILWELPDSIAAWLEERPTSPRCLLAEDVKACFGQFAALCPPEPRNAGIRGLPPGFDLGQVLREVLEEREREAGGPLALSSELDEQGLQTAALSRACPPVVVRLGEVSICSPFYPHRPEAGCCGAHFVGLNARHIAWDYYDRPADTWMSEHWQRHRPGLYQRTNTQPVEA